MVTCRVLAVGASAWLFVGHAAIGQSDYVLVLEQGDRRFEFSEAMSCIERTGDTSTRLLADRFLLLRVKGGEADKYFVNSMPENCPALSGSSFRAGLANDERDERPSEEICSGDWYTRIGRDSDLQRPVPGFDCELGTFWQISADFGAALAEGSPRLFDPARPARFAVVAAEDLGLRPRFISAEQALVNWGKIPEKDYEQCASTCAALESLQVPGCLQQGHLRDRLLGTIAELFESMPRVRLPRDACGCGTFVLADNRGVDDIDLLFASSVEAGERMESALSNLGPIGPFPAEASCLAGMTVPFSFYER